MSCEPNSEQPINQSITEPNFKSTTTDDVLTLLSLLPDPVLLHICSFHMDLTNRDVKAGFVSNDASVVVVRQEVGG